MLALMLTNSGTNFPVPPVTPVITNTTCQTFSCVSLPSLTSLIYTEDITIQISTFVDCANYWPQYPNNSKLGKLGRLHT